MSVIGVALRTTPRKQSSIACIEGVEKNPRISWVDTFRRDQELLEIVKRRRPEVVAIGSPLFLPRGLDCLEPICPCIPSCRKKGREAERQLAHVSISTFFTVKGSVVKSLVYRGISLRCSLQDQGARVIEVSPYATAVLLFGDDNVPKRGTPQKVQFLKDHLGQHIAWLKPHDKNIDEQMCHAVLSALTAWFSIHGQTEDLGDGQEGLITIPRKLVQILQ